ncbi:unnamed protein product, partial [Urochloa humidicola]
PAGALLLRHAENDANPRFLHSSQTPRRDSDPAAVAAATMPFTPGPYSGVSTLALVARASAFGVGVVYGSIKLSILKATKPKKEEAHAHH